MKEAKGNLWTFPADVRVITTNGFVKSDGRAVMGRGCAKEAVLRYRKKVGPYPACDLAQKLGALLPGGNEVYPLLSTTTQTREKHPDGSGAWVVNFPVKHKWWEDADLKLIERSAKQLVALVNMYGTSHGLKSVVLPRPGCGNGRLRWEEVKPVIEKILDDRFTVIDFGEEEKKR